MASLTNGNHLHVPALKSPMELRGMMSSLFHIMVRAGEWLLIVYDAFFREDWIGSHDERWVGDER